MKETSRREFLKFGGRAALGAVAATAVVPFEIGLNRVVEKTTGHPTGNAGVKVAIELDCESKPGSDKEACIQNYSPSLTDMANSTILGPIWEELTFRTLPSELLNSITDTNNTDPLQGEGLGLNKAEIAMGIGTSVIFGAVHNYTSKGFDKKTIPASQTLAGLAYWYLQRKLGFVSNVVAHSVNNLISLL